MQVSILRQRVQKAYSLGDRIKLLCAYENSPLSTCAICAIEGIVWSTLQTWLTKKAKYLATTRNKKLSSLGGQGRQVHMTFGTDLLAYMRNVRGDSHNLTTSHMITWLKNHQPEWLESYLGSKTNVDRAYKCLLVMCQRFTHRHGFAQRVPCFSKLKKAELQELQMSFSASFWTKYGEQPLRDIVNVDETAVNYDMPPRRIWCEVGETSEVEAKEKHSDQLKAVLAICADGTKLPILFIVRGTPGGAI
ncbi:hypothetical protein H257_15719 [Aphanomyces astaci]|uniref:DDE-1 domain-containing protein n=1 Tax=Aphanomyces astaci TaxID=112090 RepID=W4FNK3_APHAT|nr:hypothetical protein H257_15719 [Aphanomyces astaci]ETV68263.1 hypothetical protein H257_15719 [Aphanomyces astaci]|eukprot:XP_009842206.1 hypothetical protein H257_15719 [Aphanomyces astaci]